MKPLTLLSTLFLAGCAGIPKVVSPVHEFEPSRYLGAWYEIARLDHSFERGLTRVTATYSLREDGGVKVVNRGFDSRKQEWREATGKAYFVESPDIGRLKVSFSGPFTAAMTLSSWTRRITPTPSFPAPPDRICGYWRERRHWNPLYYTTWSRKPKRSDLRPTS